MIFIKHGGSMKKPNKFKYKRVRIYWQDIVSNPEWMTLNKALDQNYILGVMILVIFYLKIKEELSYLPRIVLMMMANLLLVI